MTKCKLAKTLVKVMILYLVNWVTPFLIYTSMEIPHSVLLVLPSPNKVKVLMQSSLKIDQLLWPLCYCKDLTIEKLWSYLASIH